MHYSHLALALVLSACGPVDAPAPVDVERAVDPVASPDLLLPTPAEAPAAPVSLKLPPAKPVVGLPVEQLRSAPAEVEWTASDTPAVSSSNRLDAIDVRSVDAATLLDLTRGGCDRSDASGAALIVRTDQGPVDVSCLLELDVDDLVSCACVTPLMVVPDTCVLAGPAAKPAEVRFARYASTALPQMGSMQPPELCVSDTQRATWQQQVQGSDAPNGVIPVRVEDAQAWPI